MPKLVAFLLIAVIAIPLAFLQGCSARAASGGGGELLDPNRPAAHTVGPGAGGHLYNPVINPHDSNNIFVTCDMGTQFYTKDGGKSWSPPNVFASGIPQFFFHPHDAHIVYAATSNLILISRDKGDTFNYFFPAAAGIAGIENDGSGRVRPIVKVEGAATGSFAKSDIISVYVDPDNTDHIYAITRGNGVSSGLGNGGYGNQNLGGTWSPYPPRIHVTRDGGLTWSWFTDDIPGILDDDPTATQNQKNTAKQIVGQGISNGKRYPHAEMIIFNNQLHLLNPNGYFRFNAATGAPTGHRFFNNMNGQFSLNKETNKLTAYFVMNSDSTTYPRHVMMTEDFGETIVAITENFATALRYTYHGLDVGIYQADDRINDTVFNFRGIAVSGNTLVVTWRCDPYRGIGAVARTTDNGVTWQWIMHQGGDWRFPYPVGGSTTEKSREHFIRQFPDGVYSVGAIAGRTPGDPDEIGISASNPNHIMFTTSCSAVQTLDGGVTWRDLSSRRTDDGSVVLSTDDERDAAFFQTTGLEAAGQNALAINPHNPNHHIAGWVDIGMYESFDGGKSWRNRNKVWNTYGGGNVTAIAFDPHNQGIVLTGKNEGGNLLPNNAYTSDILGMVACGCNWETIVGCPCPITTSNNNRKSLNATRLWRSTNSGDTWINMGLDVITAVDGIVFDPNKSGVVYASFQGAGIWKSINSGVDWAPINNGIDVQTIISGEQTFQGINAIKLVLSADGKSLLATLSTGDFIYELDIGNNATAWTKINRTVNRPISISKSQDGAIYASTPATTQSTYMMFNGTQIRNVINGGAYVLTDNGEWRQIFDPRITVSIIHADSRPGQEKILYLYGGGHVYVSNKGSATTKDDWKIVPGINFSATAQGSRNLLWEDPQDRARIYVATNGGGTWSLETPDGILPATPPDFPPEPCTKCNQEPCMCDEEDDPPEPCTKCNQEPCMCDEEDGPPEPCTKCNQEPCTCDEEDDPPEPCTECNQEPCTCDEEDDPPEPCTECNQEPCTCNEDSGGGNVGIIVACVGGVVFVGVMAASVFYSLRSGRRSFPAK